MIKHGPGMALCLKYVTNKVPSVAPLVVKPSHAAVCSRQIAKQCIKPSFLHEVIFFRFLFWLPEKIPCLPVHAKCRSTVEDACITSSLYLRTVNILLIQLTQLK